MSSSDSISVIEDEPYKGVYTGRDSQNSQQPVGGHLPDRFDLAEILRTTREGKGLSLDEVSEITRVRRAYLEAFEQAAYDVLPSRAFSLGYVKAYAKALGLDEESLADMFKRDMTETNVRLHAPSGASLDDVKPNYRLYVTGVGCLIAAIVVWNVVQHRPNLSFKNTQDAIANQSWAPGMPLIHDGAVYVTRPAPAPKDQDIPAPYVTPGLEAGFASIQAASNGSAEAPVPVQDVETRKAFNPQGAVYGAQPSESTVTIQATASVNLIVHSSDGTVYFAHQFAPGEAYRLPQNSLQDAVLDVSDIKAFDVYYNGEYAGPMQTAGTNVGRLNSEAIGMASALDSRQAALTGKVSTTNFAPTPALAAPQVVRPADTPIPYMPAVKANAPVKTPVKAPAAKIIIKPHATETSSSAAAPAESAVVPDASPPADKPPASDTAPNGQ